MVVILPVGAALAANEGLTVVARSNENEMVKELRDLILKKDEMARLRDSKAPRWRPETSLQFSNVVETHLVDANALPPAEAREENSTRPKDAATIETEDDPVGLELATLKNRGSVAKSTDIDRVRVLFNERTETMQVTLSTFPDTGLHLSEEEEIQEVC